MKYNMHTFRFGLGLNADFHKSQTLVGLSVKRGKLFNKYLDCCGDCHDPLFSWVCFHLNSRFPIFLHF